MINYSYMPIEHKMQKLSQLQTGQLFTHAAPFESRQRLYAFVMRTSAKIGEFTSYICMHFSDHGPGAYIFNEDVEVRAIRAHIQIKELE